RGGALLAPLPGGKILVASGQNTTTTTTPTTDVYDPATNTFSAGATMNDARVLGGMVRLSDGRLLAAAGAGGSSGGLSISSTSEVYTPSTNSWSLAGSLPASLIGFTMTALPNGQV